jgi:hypothetical protein
MTTEEFLAEALSSPANRHAVLSENSIWPGFASRTPIYTSGKRAARSLLCALGFPVRPQIFPALAPREFRSQQLNFLPKAGAPQSSRARNQLNCLYFPSDQGILTNGEGFAADCQHSHNLRNLYRTIISHFGESAESRFGVQRSERVRAAPPSRQVSSLFYAGRALATFWTEIEASGLTMCFPPESSRKCEP